MTSDNPVKQQEDISISGPSHWQKTCEAFGEIAILNITDSSSMSRKEHNHHQPQSYSIRTPLGDQGRNGDVRRTVAADEHRQFISRNANVNARAISEDDTVPGVVYKPTTVGPSIRTTVSGGHSSSRLPFVKMRNVYSESADTVEFARGLGNVIDQMVSPYAWIGLYTLIIVIAIVMITVGSLHFNHCPVNTLIPIYLIVSGVFYIIAACFRIYATWPVPGHHDTSLKTAILRKSLEGLILFFLLIWLILGCVWVYEARASVHFEERMFEQHYCDMGLYWFAWWTVTLHLILIALFILLIVVFLALGLCKQQQASSLNGNY